MYYQALPIPINFIVCLCVSAHCVHICVHICMQAYQQKDVRWYAIRRSITVDCEPFSFRFHFYAVSPSYTDVTECLPATCSRNGECKEKIGGGTHCLCNPGWTGSNCGKRIDYCDPNPCGNGAECTKLLEGYSCSCTTGFQGQVCDEGRFFFLVFVLCTWSHLTALFTGPP